MDYTLEDIYDSLYFIEKPRRWTGREFILCYEDYARTYDCADLLYQVSSEKDFPDKDYDEIMARLAIARDSMIRAKGEEISAKLGNTEISTALVQNILGEVFRYPDSPQPYEL